VDFTSEIAVRGTVLVSTLAWAGSEVLASHGAARRARLISTLGLTLLAVHVLLAFHIVYGWDHQAALVETARQTAALTGWSWGGGVFVNYAFIAVWAADVAWWWLAPAARARRPPGLEHARLALFIFMFVNGAIVFASGFGRAVGVVAVAAVLARSSRATRARAKGKGQR
jgi:hypothetical protein